MNFIYCWKFRIVKHVNSTYEQGEAGMKPNIHKIERVGRIIVGAGLVSLVFIGPANPWFLLGLIPLVTGVVGWCPPYALLGINTCPANKND